MFAIVPVVRQILKDSEQQKLFGPYGQRNSGQPRQGSCFGGNLNSSSFAIVLCQKYFTSGPSLSLFVRMELLPDPSLKHHKWSRLCSLVSMDLLQLICTDFISDPQIYAVVEKWALQFNLQHHVRSPLLGIFLLLAVPIYYFGKKKRHF
ncbi:hypothetical protein AVEN_275769-1 [Araneus ventricosus]|uniref:Uncharacterized protein n=1 Tax=Araneus ventricosus TaxID=182803 RepID=A0A4Y2HEN4_ARAVE|nr:hypothetical protein AVEN_275769-1 [Araneus ventricosus]